MKHKILKVTNSDTAKKVADFLVSRYTFDQQWTPGEKESVRKGPFDSLTCRNHAYWYVEYEGKVIAAGGVRENRLKSGGYEMIDDNIAVHKDYRRQGIASLLMGTIESFVKKHKGRYILVETCDIDSYAAARSMFKKRGYKLAGKIPDYFVKGKGKIEYLLTL